MNIKNVLIASCLVLLVFTIGPFLYRPNAVQLNSAVATPNSQKKPARVNAVKSNSKTSGRTDSKTPDAFYQVIMTTTFFVHWDGDYPKNHNSIPSSVQQVPLMVAIRKLSS